MGIYRLLSQWKEKVDGTLTGPSLETDSATVNGTTTTDALEAGSIDVSDRILQSGDALGPGITTGAIEKADNVTATSYTTVARTNGLIDGSRVPPGATLYGNTTARLSNDTAGESVTVAPLLGGVGVLDSMSLTKTGTTVETVTSGWQEITETVADVSQISVAQAKVSGGTGIFSSENIFFAFEWRLD